MRIRTRILIVVAFAAVLPVAVTAWTSLGIHQRAFDRQLTKLRVQAAQFGADLAQRDLEGTLKALAGLAQRSTDWPTLTRAEREGALWLIYSQLDDVAAVTVKKADGSPATGTAHLGPNQAKDQWAGHAELDAESVERFANSIQPGPRPDASPVVGELFIVGGQPVVTVSFGAAGTTDNNPWVVGVALTTTSLCNRFLARRPENSRAFLLDKNGARICAAGGTPLEVGPEATLVPDGHVEFSVSQEDFVASVADNKFGWRAIIAQSAALAAAPKKEIRQRALFWLGLGLLGAYLAGILLSVGIAKPIQSLEKAAARVAAGDFDHRIKLDTRDEVGALARAFNSMSAEIKHWNAELQERVDKRTRELKNAQGQLLEARKLAAMASLSAGVAHEINNPLTAVLALTQVLARKASRGGEIKNAPDILASIEKEAQRIAEIIETMRALDETEQAGFMDHSLNDIVAGVIDRFRDNAEEHGLNVHLELGDDLPAVYCNSERLGRAIASLVDNGIKATQGSGSVAIKSRHVDGELVVLEVSDTGRGIPEEIQTKIFEPFFTTKDHWRGTGMGLAVAHQIVSKHNGRLHVDSTLGQGSTFTISLPATSKRAHLV